jgi:hypothetical protein
VIKVFDKIFGKKRKMKWKIYDIHKGRTSWFVKIA